MKSLLEIFNEVDENLWQSDVVLKRNQVLLAEGETEKYVYYVKEGALIVLLAKEGEDHCIRFGYEGSIITALDSFITGKPSQYSIKAIRKTVVQRMKIVDYNRFMLESEERRLIREAFFTQLVYQQMEREIDLLTLSPKDRYERVLKRSPKLFQEIPSRYIASYLRMSPETFSRIKKS